MFTVRHMVLCNRHVRLPCFVDDREQSIHQRDDTCRVSAVFNGFHCVNELSWRMREAASMQHAFDTDVLDFSSEIIGLQFNFALE